ncbi:MAG: DNA-directed RNA polymerase subunit beta' [Chloroflexi bacterium]|nr:DNA-directed RNA polymerase subunit beta' [Chloroflexota bacterium]
MLEVNDFNAVRISLASPEQIRQWSYGEVTKPETINYRTLRPEKDGLFCERIFGPTKDWECYCGKYKRVRYKGVVCEKCGVEVARAKVRRERMGHINLASPVAHIWFAKGIPSRIGLVLDVSPRNLERVLYFVQYIISAVDEEARARALEQLESERLGEISRLEKAAQEQIAEVSRPTEVRIAELQSEHEASVQELRDRLAAQLAELSAGADAARDQLQELLGEPAPEDVVLGDATIVGKGAPVQESHLEALENERLQQAETIERENGEDLADLAARLDSDINVLRHGLSEQTARIEAKLQEDVAALGVSADERRKDLEGLAVGQLLTEGKYRDLHDRFSQVFQAGMGAEAVRDILAGIDLDTLAAKLRAEIIQAAGSAQRRKRATKRLRVVEAFRKSGNRPEWMILTVLPVLPPELRPMVQLDGGRFATSDLNDLYRRVINRNNRLRRLMELGAPEIIIRNEKRMLQEAVDSLIDNGRRGRAVANASNHKLKSLSDMLKGKQGRFRQNLLGKRVDYSGRSVIVVGPNLKLHQCGLPKKMALELFKPFVMRQLMERGFAHNIKSAKRIVERMRGEVWDVLEDVIQDHPVLLNRAPTLHRLGIQAFQPILIEGSAIQIHPLVCTAFGADFDGDQMAVHVPLSSAAKEEARNLMLSSKNLLSPASGDPIVSPTLDIVLGSYYLTAMRPGARGEGRAFADEQEAWLAHELGQIDTQAEIKVRMPDRETGEMNLVSTTMGRIMFNEALPDELPFHNSTIDRKGLRDLVGECYRRFGVERTAELVDDLKRVGFRNATRSGITIAIGDIKIPESRDTLLQEADAQIEDIQDQYRNGLITENERYTQAVEVWTKTTDDVTKAVDDTLDRFGPLYMMTRSGAKGNIQQLRQMAAMRGLMTAPSGRIIELPIRSSFREGLSVLEYFISTHGARKGLADTAIRTADSGYLTRRLIDVAHDVVVQMEDCGTTSGIWIEDRSEAGLMETLQERVIGRLAASEITDPATGDVIVAANEEIDEAKAKEIARAGIKRVHVRSPLTCEARRGICQDCYGRSLARGRLVDIGEAVGIIAAESIGEPGTQLTMRTFHTGGIAGLDITSGLPRVEELFEARAPKGQALISEIEGVVELRREEDVRKLKVVSLETYTDEYPLPADAEVLVHEGDWVDIGTSLFKSGEVDTIARMAGKATVEEERIVITYEDREEREYDVPLAARLRVENGERVQAGELLTDGAANPQDILRILGREAVQAYLVEEVQKVYRSQGVSINDKHIEIMVRQMLRRVRVDTPGDTDLLAGELVDRFEFEEVNAHVLAEGGEPATAQTVLLGVTKAALSTDSFLAAASFQETTRVLTEAAIRGNVDHLVGLKENVIIGKLIPAGTGTGKRAERKRKFADFLPPAIDRDDNA